MIGKMTDHQKAKHDFAMHQDRMLWSRLPLLALTQGIALAGTYNYRSDLTIARWLCLIGVALTVLVGLAMLRDDLLSSAAFKETGLRKTRPKYWWWCEKWLLVDWWLKGWLFALVAFAILFAADFALWQHVKSLPPPPPSFVPPAAD